jgi:uncharacterized protein
MLSPMRQPSAELFPTDSPIPGSQLIGRAQDVRHITDAMTAGTHVVLAGPRRTGKTSVCEAALTRLRASGMYTVEIDLFRIADAAELAETLAVKVLENRSNAIKTLHKARTLGKGALSTAQGALALKLSTQLGDGVELALTPGSAQVSPNRALDQALELPERVAKADDTRLVAFFDEFQEIAGARKPYGDPDAVTKRMRAVFQGSTHVSYLFAGSIEHVMRDLFAPNQRAFSGFGSFHTLAEIPQDAWLEGLPERFAADDCTIEGRALQRLVDLGYGHPRATMLIAQQTHLVCVQLDTRRIGADEVALGYEAALRGDTPVMEQLIDRIRLLHKSALSMARAVAEGKSPPPAIPVGVRDRVLKQLRDAGIVTKHGRGDYRIVNPLFREYLRRTGRL